MASGRSGVSSNIGGNDARAAIRRVGLTLIELLVVLAIMLILAGLGLSLIRHTMEERDLTQCTANLRQVGMAMNAYINEWRSLPRAVPPFGFGDLHNWGDRYAATNPPEYEPYGNTTVYPRVPRLLVGYLTELELLICPCNGATAYWPETGPYYFNVTSPWNAETLPDGTMVTNYGKWVPRVSLLRGKNQALAACQNPQRSSQAYGSWRHGTRAPSDPDGINNHLLVGGSVHRLPNPANWTVRTPGR